MSMVAVIVLVVAVGGPLLWAAMRVAGREGLALSAEDANNPLLQSLRGLASAPGTPTGATVATRAVHRAATEAEGAATRRLPVFARIAEEGAR